MQLPPKRFQSCQDPRYDSIRFFPWFRHLEQRREKLGQLSQAKSYLDSSKVTQEQAAKEWQVDSRELRDYISFMEGRGSPISKSQQHLIDAAYRHYCEGKGEFPFRESIYALARMYGFNPRHIHELWDVDCNFYPNDYKKC